MGEGGIRDSLAEVEGHFFLDEVHGLYVFENFSIIN